MGCGGRGTGAANQALKADENIELVAMADAFEDRLAGSLGQLETEFSGSDKVKVKKEHQYTGFDAYKKAIDKADVVILTTPPGFRPYHFEYAVNAGKHVFMEKPVATDVPGIRKVLDAAKIAKANKLHVVVGHICILALNLEMTSPSNASPKAVLLHNTSRLLSEPKWQV